MKTCPLTRSPALRKKADAATSKIQGNFPKGLSQPALRALATAQLNTLNDLTTIKKESFAQLHGIGPKALALLEQALDQQGKSFAV